MSRRLHQKGRYPKVPSAEQMTSTNSQFPQNPPVSASPMPFYDPSLQPQPDQNSWAQPSYSTTHAFQQNQVTHQPAFPIPNTYLQNQSSHPPVSDSTGYWSGGQMHPPPSQPPWNESWNYKPENIADNTGYANYQQSATIPAPAEQWQQIPYSQIDNQNCPQQETLIYNPETLQEAYQPSAGYPLTNNNSNAVPNTTLPAWENGGMGVMQTEQSSWAYNASQYPNSVPTPLQDYTQNTNPATNTTSWPLDSNNYLPVTGSGYGNQDIPSTNYSFTNTENVSSASSSNLSPNYSPPIQQSDISKFEADSANIALDHEVDVASREQTAAELEYATSTLSAFFQNNDQGDLSDHSERAAATPVPEIAAELSSQEESESPVPDVTANQIVASVPSLEEMACGDGSEINFIQKEKVIDLELEVIGDSSSSTPTGFIEEPINQEVPEPHQIELSSIHAQPKQGQDEEISTEEPPNQQIPTQSGQTSRSTSSERERMVIRPREESPFKPPRPSTKGIVVQQETSPHNHPEAKFPEGKTVVHEVNLETFPDNLERPSDYEEMRKQSPLYVSHKHLRSELNSSPSSLLCDSVDIPCVTLAPAAPPLSSSTKSDKSESSTDSKSEIMALGKPNVSVLKLNESNLPGSASDIQDAAAYENSKNRHVSRKETSNVPPSRSREPLKTTAPHTKQYDIMKPDVASKLIKEEREKSEHSQPVYLKDSKINGKSSASNRDPESMRYPPANTHPSESTSSLSRMNRRDPVYASNERIDSRYGSDNLDVSRQRFADQKYPSFDERQYYSDRERSRPSSRSSLRERPDDYPYHQPKPDDYPYQSRGGDPRRYPPDHGRPSSRMSESDTSRSDRQGQQGYYRQPYAYPPGAYPRNSDYYQRPPNQRGYDYDQYQRDPYYSSYYDAYRYAYSNYNYGFYDELYRNDPRYKQYQEQCRQYYAKYGYDVDYERSSGHSGRSSANELSKEGIRSRYPEQDIDSNDSEFSAYNLEQNYSYDDGQNEILNNDADQASTPSSRLTPVKFSYAHPIARFSPGGLLITVIPNQTNTNPATPVHIHNLQAIREDEESFQELKSHQGPLIRGLTHKNDVIEFCTQKIKNIKSIDDVVDRDSYMLLWELMVLLLRQNGSVAGSDIAELLLKDHEVLRPPSLPLRHTTETPQGEHSPADVNDSSSQSHAGDTSSPDEGIVVLSDKTLLNSSRTVDVDKITRKFREFLLFGHKKDALEWAMKHGLWGHALFLASKMDLRTYANVMTRFANSLALNDPLQTLYQLMSGRQPLAVTNVADKRWGDWRPHLAMILSNPSAHPDVDSRSITTLGDTLANRGCLCAAHFCYIMAQVEFGTYEQSNSKFVLLTKDHTLPFEEFSSNEAIQITEIYEYAQSLANPTYLLVHLQFYKLLYAMRLVEHGFFEEGLHYCEIIAEKIQAHSHLFQLDFITEVFKLATLLKYHDPHFLRGQGEFEDQDDPDWLKNLSTLVQNFNNFSPADQSQTSYVEQTIDVNQTPQNTNNLQFPNQSNESIPFQNVPNSIAQNEVNTSYNHVNFYQPNAWNQQNSIPNSTFSPGSSPHENTGYYQGDGIANQSSFHRQSSLPSHEENETTDVPSSPVTQTPPFDYYSAGPQQQMHESKPMYDISNSYNNSSSHRERRDSAMSSGSRYSTSSISVANKSSAKELQKSDVKKDKHATQAGKTWLGGIFSRLLPKGPNQMILPDDKNPTIVWDDVKNCWVNKDSNDDDESSAPLAPPTDMELMGSKSSTKTFHTQGNSMPPTTSSVPGSSVPPTSSLPANKFQRPKTRGMRQNYVDILNTSGATKKANVLPEGLFPSTYENTNSPQMFVPAPAPSAIGDNSTEFESSHVEYNSAPLGREEQPERLSTPLMLDPAEFDARRSNMNSQRHTLGRTGRRTYPT